MEEGIAGREHGRVEGWEEGGMREEEKGVGELGERCLNGVKKREHLSREGGSA